MTRLILLFSLLGVAHGDILRFLRGAARAFTCPTPKSIDASRLAQVTKVGKSRECAECNLVLSFDEVQNPDQYPNFNDINDKGGVPDAFWCQCQFFDDDMVGFYNEDDDLHPVTDDMIITISVVCEGYATCSQCCREYGDFRDGY